MRAIGVCLCLLVSGVALAQVHDHAAMAKGQAPAAAPAAVVPAPLAGAAPAAGAVPEVQRSYEGVKANILKSAEKMPAADFGYKPFPDVRTYARVVNHVTEAQLRSCGTINATLAEKLAKVPAETASKEEIVTALKASFAECDKAFATLMPGNLQDLFTFGPGKRSRVGLVWGTVSHDNEQYATLALYLRMKNIAPPSTEK
jgi:hypothetical protein